jgi:hypothetical protein
MRDFRSVVRSANVHVVGLALLHAARAWALSGVVSKRRDKHVVSAVEPRS